MADDKLAKMYTTQKSLTEWLDDIKHADATLIRVEDNEKRERLKLLNGVIGLPFDRPTQFEASEMNDSNSVFVSFLKSRGEELCALRLIPKVNSLPKLRTRGKTIAKAFDWYLEQDIDYKNYKADFVPHAADSSWATIFIVNKNGIQGEIIYGGHHQLTQGFHEESTPSTFRFDFNEWTIFPKNDEAVSYLKELVKYIHVPDMDKQKVLEEKLDSKFIKDYLHGYFETTDSSMGTWYIDYNRLLGNLYDDALVRIEPSNTEKSLVSGQTGCNGKATGPVQIVKPGSIDPSLFPVGAVLVCSVTTPEFVPLMQKASAIITDQGGILSHAAIVARELQKPCIVGTGDATKVLNDNDIVSVDASIGSVTLGS